jgi:hypothetical protein
MKNVYFLLSSYFHFFTFKKTMDFNCIADESMEKMKPYKNTKGKNVENSITAKEVKVLRVVFTFRRNNAYSHLFLVSLSRFNFRPGLYLTSNLNRTMCKKYLVNNDIYRVF